MARCLVSSPSTAGNKQDDNSWVLQTNNELLLHSSYHGTRQDCSCSLTHFTYIHSLISQNWGTKLIIAGPTFAICATNPFRLQQSAAAASPCQIALSHFDASILLIAHLILAWFVEIGCLMADCSLDMSSAAFKTQ
jgi:hypothetical protein